VRSDQQPTSGIATSSVRTAITPLSAEDYNAFVGTAIACLGVASPLGFLAGFTYTLLAQPTGSIERNLLTNAAEGAEASGGEALTVMLNQVASDFGLPPNFVSPIANVGQCVTALHNGGYID
jgi:hypothetical protein